MPVLPPASRIAVLGAGLTGLTAAWHLRRAGHRPVVFEASDRVGGAIGAWREGGWLHELGPNTLLEGSAEVAAFIDAVGLGGRRRYAAEAAKQRYIVRGGRLVPLPTGPFGFLRTPLFSWRAKLGLAGEPWRARGAADGEESVADFVVRRLGREFLDYAVNPFVAGVYAGDPRRLSVRHAFPRLHALEQEHGSLLRGAWRRRNASGGPKGRILSFPGGLEELPQAIAAGLAGEVRLGVRVQSLRRSAGGWSVGHADGSEDFAAVVSALPADALASLPVEGVDPALAGTLREIEQPPVASVFLGYRREDVAHPLDGFGMLVPEVEGGRLLGGLFSSTLFPGRAPEGHVALTCFVGGTRQPELGRRPADELVAVVRAELGRLLGVRGDPVVARVRAWPRAIPQYTLGYQRFQDVGAAIERSAPGLLVGGNLRDGISLANCISGGRRLAAALAGPGGLGP